MKSKKPISIGEFEILYICISTNQNTINLYPLRMGIPLYTNFHLLILSSFKATKELWTARLVTALNDAVTSNTLDISETESTTINLDKIVSFIEGTYALHKKSIVVVNYGGGLKQFTMSLFRLKDLLKDAKIHYVYPDKFSEKLLVTEYDVKSVESQGTVFIHTKEHFENDHSLSLDYRFTQILSLYANKNFTFSTLINRFEPKTVDEQLLTFIQHFPDFYSHNESTDFLYKLSSSEATENGEEDLAIFSRLKNDNNYKNEIIENIIADFHKKYKKVGYEIVDNFSLKYKNENIHSISTLPGCFREVFWNKSNYQTEKKVVTLSQDLISIFKNLGLNFNKDADKEIQITAGFLKELLRNHYDFPEHKTIGHGIYFEYYCLHKLYLWAQENNDIVNELLFNFRSESVGMYQFQIEAVLFTKSGNIHFFECKTFDFDHKDFLAAYLNMSELGGVFNQYTVILPPLPSETSPAYRNKAVQKFTTLNQNIKGRYLAFICQAEGVTGKLADIPSLDARLNKIAKDERII